ncbi:arsenic transporter [Alicyclobacillus dauci]|uniref:Arsenic transporter n=1 Tax=Alicyclobacillus dauci TaxID=1475485 RepID=A0ABY6Z1R4_9BACL|nr:arsenic transporter [Alicyclobacillus dauci]WAH36291.1 arsenic transporter [Alicyclobacillus dauci]
MQTWTVILTVASFIMTVVLILWRPRGLNEAIPAICGAALTVLSGSVSLEDLRTIGADVGGATVTILSTIAMAIVLESFGVFQFAANFLARLSKNSGVRLFWYINLMSLLMTMFFNNDGGIIIATPILLILLNKLGLKPHQQIPYLISGALIDTAASAPIGVSNIVNLISLKIIGMNLITFSSMMFVPAMTGLGVLSLLNYLVLKKELPRDLAANRAVQGPRPHLQHRSVWPPRRAFPTLERHTQKEIEFDVPSKAKVRFIRNVLLYVLAVRVGLFLGAYFGIPVSVTAVLGAAILLVWRWLKMRTSPIDVIKKTPWHILVFAFGMYVVVYGMHKIGLTTWLMREIEPLVTGSGLHAVATTAILVTIMSNIFNNHPALMIGTLTLTNMHLDPMTLKVAYLGNVIGSDIGSLIMPIGLLATLIWMYILKQHHVHISWGRYIRLTAIVIPVTVLVTILLVYGWVHLIY